MYNPFSLKNKVILITGGYGYLGRHITKGLLDSGAQVVVLGRNEEKFKSAFNYSNPDLIFQKTDISSSSEVDSSFQQLYQKFGRIDALINNAIYSKGQQPLNITDEEFAFTLDGNLGSVYRCIKAITPYFMQQQGGRVINVSSMYGMVSPEFSIYKNHEAYLNPPHYGAAKAGLLQLTRYFACYLGKNNILVNAVSPGPFPSEKVQESESFISNLRAKSPLGRIGNPAELKGIFVFLCSDEATYITGQNLVVDGGWTAW
ncbi:gluconate 5-dehydrogenase [Adhaeribacter arboris]|uniref:Gluconate 5-dehydrogenase n=1 Tax=Adhaeribacter arboris TaxID=2072846 RepID=A0A2T2YAJ1_9BACT|nr:SDR family oxidoreductase [Adhaeribacter arboris]PSR52458.1 gluconate 5-dehydrogenase [Adhaeribacter arboris]